MALSVASAPPDIMLPVLAGNQPGPSLQDLATEHGTPLYAYDLAVLRRRVGELRSAFGAPGMRLYFATMANDRLPVLRELAGLDVGACVNSRPHLDLALAAGFPSTNVQFTSTGITRPDMELLQSRGIRANLDSIPQLETWFDLGAGDAGLRVNAASLSRGRPDRIGVDAAEIPRAVDIARRRGTRITGLHVYVGTNFQRPDEMAPTLGAFFQAARQLPDLRYVNIGGGIGVNYNKEEPSFDVSRLGAMVAGWLDRLREAQGRAIELIVEPGRALVAGCGTFVVSVTDVKELNGEELVVVDGSVAVFPRPLIHPDMPHHISTIGGTCAAPSRRREFTIVGRTTYSRDILGTLRQDHRPLVGDLLAFADAGAYSQSMMTRFLGQPAPSVVYLAAGERE